MRLPDPMPLEAYTRDAPSTSAASCPQNLRPPVPRWHAEPQPQPHPASDVTTPTTISTYSLCPASASCTLPSKGCEPRDPINRPPSCERATTAPQSPRGGEAASASPNARPPPSQPNPQRTYLHSLPTTKTRPIQTRCATEPAHCAPDSEAQKQAASMPISPTAVTRQPRALPPETPQTRRPTTQPPDSHRKHRDNHFTQETNASSPQKLVVPNQPPDARMPTRCSTATQGQTYLQRAAQQTPQRRT